MYCIMKEMGESSKVIFVGSKNECIEALETLNYLFFEDDILVKGSREILFAYINNTEIIYTVEHVLYDSTFDMVLGE